MRFDILYTVLHSADGQDWHLVQDEDTDRIVPAVYIHESDANARRDDLAAAFPGHHYKVVEGIVQWLTGPE